MNTRHVRTHLTGWCVGSFVLCWKIHLTKRISTGTMSKLNTSFRYNRVKVPRTLDGSSTTGYFAKWKGVKNAIMGRYIIHLGRLGSDITHTPIVIS